MICPRRLSDDDAARLVGALRKRKRETRSSWDRLASDLTVNRRTLVRWTRGGPVSYRLGLGAALSLGCRVRGSLEEGLLSRDAPFEWLARVDRADSRTGMLVACQAGAWLLATVKGLRLETDETGACVVTKRVSETPVASVRLVFKDGFLSYSLADPALPDRELGSGAATGLGLGFCSEFLEERGRKEAGGLKLLGRMRGELAKKFV